MKHEKDGTLSLMVCGTFILQTSSFKLQSEMIFTRKSRRRGPSNSQK